MYSRCSYMCRSSRICKLYNAPTDIKPSSKILPKSVMFISNRIYVNGSVTLFEISESVGTQEVPIGLWIANDVIEYCTLETEESIEEKTQSDDSVECNETLLINGSSISIYDKWDSSTPIKGGLELGSTITVDRKVNFSVNGVTQTRYRMVEIKQPNKESADLFLGMWILGNYSVTNTNQTVVIHNPSVRAATAPISTTVTQPHSATEPAPVSTPTTNDGVTVSTGDQEANNQVDYNEQTMDELYESYGFNYNSAGNVMSIPLGRMIFVHGMPFQYTHLTDRRGNSHNQYGKESTVNETTKLSASDGTIDMYGRSFAKEIASNMPIAVIVPGVPRFITNVKEGLLGSYRGENATRNNWIPFWNDLTDTELESAMQNFMQNGKDGDYQYYTMEVDTTDYFNYVNALCQNSAKMMGLSTFKYHGKMCDKLDWGKYNSSADQDYSMFEEVTGISGGVSFAFDPLSSITDSISNSTGESQFAGFINGLSAKARELEFMTGTVANFNMINSEDYEASIASLDDGTFSGITNAVNRVKSFINNTAHGVNVRFPLLWNDSNSSKSYDLDMRFITPYSTTFCKWRYVLVPFFHVFCLAAPRSDTSVVNYKRPFLIRAFSKGYFNVEMGIIESLQWKRFGDGDMISEDGVPTQIDVTISFQDLYQQLAMSKTDGPTAIGIFFNNTGLMDMMGTLSGVNMNRISLGERLSLYASSATGAFSRIGSNFFRRFSDRTRNVAERFFVGL